MKKEDGLLTFGKLKPRHKANKVSSQVEASWKYSIPSNQDKSRLKELWRTQLQHFTTLLNAVENHPDFHRTWQHGSAVPVSRDVTYASSPEASFRLWCDTGQCQLFLCNQSSLPAKPATCSDMQFFNFFLWQLARTSSAFILYKLWQPRTTQQSWAIARRGMASYDQDGNMCFQC